MSETNALSGGAPEQPNTSQPEHGGSITKSDTVVPNDPQTGEAPAAPLEPPKPEDAPPEKPAKTEKPWYEDRIAKQSRKIADEGRRADNLQRQLDELRAANARAAASPDQPAQPGPQPTAPADIERLIEQRAAERVTAERQAAAANEFNAECNRIASAGAKEFPDFSDALQSLWNSTDGLDNNGAMKPQTVAMIEAAAETGKAHQVLHHLGRNPEEAIRIAGLPTEAKRAAAIVKLANTLEAPKAVSRAPTPIAPVAGGSARNETDILNTRDTGDYVRKRLEHWKAKTGR